MIPVFESVKEVEKEISVYYSSDEFIAETLMIENASSSLEKIIFKNVQKVKSIFISSFIHPFNDSIIGLSVGVPALDIDRLILV